ncbi:unnamed protein product [Arabidopsis lyrata]|nr:unnamed protein product [Arabidopsis lyrata]
MTIMSDLPRDLLAEILSKVPLTSLRAVRFTCKKWNDLSKDRSFHKKQIIEAKKKQLKEFEVIMMRNFRVYLTSVDIHSDVDPSFTPKERFGPRLPLPFNSSPTWEDIVTLSSVGEDQLAVLFQSNRTKWMEIWITSKIEPTEVSWNKLFLAVDMRALTRFEFLAHAGSFFIDQKKNVVVVFDRDMDAPTDRGMAYIIGKNGYFRKVDLGEDADSSCYPLVCSYVPSSVQIRQLT